MRSEYRTDLRFIRFEIERTRYGQPLVEVRYDPSRGGADRLDKICDNAGCCVAEQHGFDVVPAARDGIDSILIPHRAQQVIAIVYQRPEIDQHYNRSADYIPTPHPDANAHIIERISPAAHQVKILFKFRMDIIVL